MSKLYGGSINLDIIKDAIASGVQPFEGKKGKYLNISCWVNDTPDQYGNEVSISIYNKDTKQSFYLGNLKQIQKQQEEQPQADVPF